MIWKTEIINGGYGTTTRLHQGLGDLEKSIKLLFGSEKKQKIKKHPYS
jgi:hypothetical protein